jgi:hypothetical protein
LLWAGLPIAIGVVLHAEVEQALTWLEGMGTGALFVIAGVIALYVAVKLVERFLLIRFLRMVRIGVEELRGMLADESRPVILDVRSAAARRLDPRHIPGAIPVDMTAPQAHLGAVLPDRDVVVYCS